MDEKTLQKLLIQPEGLKIEFKQKFYDIYHANDDYKRSQRNELKRDILGLVNGNYNSVRENGYMIVGAGDQIRDDGSRELFNCDLKLSSHQILQIVNSACHPPIPNLICDFVEINNKRILVITLPPSPHIHKTKVELSYLHRKAIFPAGTIFVRRNEDTFPATEEEIKAIFQEKLSLFSYGQKGQNIDNIPKSGVIQFIGRNSEIKQIEQHLELQDSSQSVALIGMGGVGKTELALQYAKGYLDKSNKGCCCVCWIDARGSNIGIQIIQFSKVYLGIDTPGELSLKDKVQYCWQNWNFDKKLVVFDDINDYAVDLREYLPPDSLEFKILITSRKKIGKIISHISLNVLSKESAYQLFFSIANDQNIGEDSNLFVQEICDYLGYLPLGIELVASYVYRNENLNLSDLHSLLEQEKLEHPSILEVDPTMTSQTNLKTAFYLSWRELDGETKNLAILLSLFPGMEIPEEIIETVIRQEIVVSNNLFLHPLNQVIEKLEKPHLITNNKQGYYRIHPLVSSFFRHVSDTIHSHELLKQAFIGGIIELARSFPAYPDYQDLDNYVSVIPCIEELIGNDSLSQYINSHDFPYLLIASQKFYNSRALYENLEALLFKGLELAKKNME